jgi:hypothetical protein
MPELQKDKPDRTVWVAIIGALAVVAAAIIAKMDFSNDNTNTSPQTEVQEEKKPQPSESIKAPATLKPNPNLREEVPKPTDNESHLKICFENIDDGSQLKNYEIKFEGYSIRVKTDNVGCANIPTKIINHEKSISSYTIRATLLSESAISESVEIGLSQSSTYKIVLKK